MCVGCELGVTAVVGGSGVALINGVLYADSQCAVGGDGMLLGTLGLGLVKSVPGDFS